MTTPSFPDDLQSWVIKNRPAIWAEWLMAAPHNMDFDDWITEEHYDILEAKNNDTTH